MVFFKNSLNIRNFKLVAFFWRKQLMDAVDKTVALVKKSNRERLINMRCSKAAHCFMKQ
jgi:hypothetical protein